MTIEYIYNAYKLYVKYYKIIYLNDLKYLFVLSEDLINIIYHIFLENNSRNISNRMAKVGEYNEILNFYCSDKASYISGSCIFVDGGALSIL
jgi:hypothetical protein